MSVARRLAIVASAALTVGAITVAADASDTPPVPTAAVHAVHTSAVHGVLATVLLDRLAVRAHSHTTTYKRSLFTLWIDADHDGENTRAEVLVRQSTVRVTENAHHTVETGHWVSPYDGGVYKTAAKLQIDHLVPLENAWVSGAASWPAAKREAYANDLAYAPALVAVTGSLNEKKGDDDPSAFLPPRQADVCTYVEAWIGVKTRWHLSVTATEKQALAHDLATDCSAAARRMGTPPSPDVAALDGGRAATSGSGSSSGSATPPRATASPTPSAPASASTSSPPDEGVVHPGAFCTPQGATGVTTKGTAMHCEPASDGRLRWISA